MKRTEEEEAIIQNYSALDMGHNGRGHAGSMKNPKELSSREAVKLMAEYWIEYPSGENPSVHISRSVDGDKWALFVARGVASLSLPSTVPIETLVSALKGIGFGVDNEGQIIDYRKVVFGTDAELHGELEKVAPRKKPDPQVLEAARVDTRIDRIKRGEPADSGDWIRWAWKKAGGRLPGEPPQGQLFLGLEEA